LRRSADRLSAAVWLLAAAKVAALLGSTRLSFHRDELYFIEASKHLAPSYVDFQPIVPLLVRTERALFGDSLLSLRLIPALAGAAIVVLAALIARELGGGRRAQIFAAFTGVVVPVLFGMGATLNTVSLETPAWMLVALVVARLLRTQDNRLWVALGAAISLGLLVKFTELAYLAGLGVAILATPLRKDFRTPWPWLGGVVIAGALAPSLAWQASHHWAVVEFVRHQGTGGRVLGLGGRAGFLASLALLPGPVALWVWVPGIRRLWRDDKFRALAITHGLAFAVLFAASGKGYYAGPGIAVLLAAGSVALDIRPGWSPRRLVVGLVATLVLVLPLFLAPISWLRASKDLAQANELSEHIGWDDMAATVSRVYRSLPLADRNRAVAIGSNYTIPAALDFYAKRFPLPPAGSGHNSAYLWRPLVPDDHVAIAIGFDATQLRRLYADIQRVATITNREGVHGYDWGDPVFLCRGPRMTWTAEWRQLKRFTA
jgi:hypothetical protein